MKILFVTQKVDSQDGVLGFVHGWLAAFAGCFDSITVICLEKGRVDLPSNVRLLSLGKERLKVEECQFVDLSAGTSVKAGAPALAGKLKIFRRAVYALRFIKIIWQARRDFDAVFVHMNPEYVILGFPFFKFWGKKVVFWYNHTVGGSMARLAFLLADKICHTSPYAFSAGRKKSVRMPAGIDTDLFIPGSDDASKRNRIIYLGRLSPLKRVETLIEACLSLDRDSVDFKLQIVGAAPARDLGYEKKLRSLAAPLVSSGKAVFSGDIPNTAAPAFLNEAAIAVNLTPAGNYDKTVLEAMACGAVSLVSSPAFAGVLPDEFRFKEKDPADLAVKLKMILGLTNDDRQRIATDLRRKVLEKESLILLTNRLEKLFLDFYPKAREASEAMKLTKLFYVANARLPSEKAHAIQIVKMCEAFLEVGVDLTVIAPKRGVFSSLQSFYGLRREIPVVRLPVLPCYNFGKVGYRLATLSFMKVALIYLWWRKIIGEKARVHLIDMDQLSIGIGPLSPFPFTLEVHDAKPKTSWFRWVFKNAQAVLTINNIIKGKIIERFGITSEKILVFPNGIDLELFKKKFSKEEARKKLDLPIEGRMIMYTGQFYFWKGLEIFVAVARLMPEVSFYLVGGTKEGFVAVTKIADLPPNLIFAGKQPFTEIPIWLNASDAAVVLGTKRDEYSFYHTSPMKLFEYMAAAVPIIAAKTPAIADAVSGQEVFFYEPDSAPSMAEKTREVIGGGEAVKSKTVAALAKAQNLSWGKRVEALFKLQS